MKYSLIVINDKYTAATNTKARDTTVPRTGKPRFIIESSQCFDNTCSLIVCDSGYTQKTAQRPLGMTPAPASRHHYVSNTKYHFIAITVNPSTLPHSTLSYIFSQIDEILHYNHHSPPTNNRT